LEQLGIGGGPAGQFVDDFGLDEERLLEAMAKALLGVVKEYPEVKKILEDPKSRVTLVHKIGTGNIELPLIPILSTWLPFAYEHHLPRHGDYEKEKVLEKATQTLMDMIRHLFEYVLDNLEAHILVQPWILTTAGGKARKVLDRELKIKLKPGRKPADRESNEQEIVQTYKDTLKILTPGWDENDRSTNKMTAALAATNAAGIKDDNYTADQMWCKRSVKQAAIYLTAQKLGISESTVKRHLSGK